MPEYRTLKLEQLLKWAEDNNDIMRLRSDRDLLPGGYLAALSPVLVAWQESDIQSQSGHLILRNVNYGGNPMERTTVLHSVRVPLDGIEAVELILVPLGRRKHKGSAYHVELRFIFSAARCPEFINLADSTTGTDACFPDLILSWEAWRSPQQKFSLKAGLDESAYALSMRAFAGPQLFLEDSVRGREWISYRLHLPGGKPGLQELLKVVLAQGDGVARNTIRRLLQQDDDSWMAHAPAAESKPESEEPAWKELRTRLAATKSPEFELADLAESEQSYHVLVRSCATLTRHAVLLTAWRLVEQGYTDGLNMDKLPRAELAQIESWMSTMAHADLRQIFLSAPDALRFLVRNPQVLPAKIPDELDAAGLLERKGGKLREIRYGRNALRPYAANGGVKHVD